MYRTIQVEQNKSCTLILTSLRKKTKTKKNFFFSALELAPFRRSFFSAGLRLVVFVVVLLLLVVKFGIWCRIVLFVSSSVVHLLHFSALWLNLDQEERL